MGVAVIEFATGGFNEAEIALRQLYNGRASGYREGSGKVAWVGPDRLMERLAHILPIQDDHEFSGLDLGAGTGEIGARLKQIRTGAFVTGVDLSEEMLKTAVADRFVDKAHQGSVTDLTWVPAASQDVITACGVLDHLPPDAIPKLAGEMVRIARPGAAIGFTFEAENSANPGPKKNTRFNVESLAAHFRTAGAKIVEVTTIMPAWFLGDGEKRRAVENRILLARVHGR